MGIHQKLLKIQQSLKAPKGQHNSYGDYKYRSCEDILEAVKPLLAKENCTLTISDEIVTYGNRYYIQAAASLTDVETGESLRITGYARETESKKGMDESQITGAASSYARKYTLNGMFCIDDTKDSDTMDNRQLTESCSVCGDAVENETLIAKTKEAYGGIHCKKCANERFFKEQEERAAANG